MKIHTNNFKNTIKTIGRELDSIITYTINGTITTLTNEQINSITPHYESSLLKSVMKQLDIDSNVEIPLETIINYQFGLKIGNSYEYLDFGNYVVYKVEKQEDTNSWKITCYDKMLYAMKNYESLNITYPITIRNYINAICNKLGLTFANINDTFANYNRQISNEVYLDGNGNSLGYTYRDVLDELAQVTASIICINSDDELEIRYPNETNDVIDEEYLKDVNVNFGEKYGPINSIVLTRASESDSVYLRDEESVQTDGLCEIKIKDNQIMNLNNRADYLPDILEELDGLQYYYNDFSSTGITYYDVYDKYQISIGESLYDCIMFNDEINITQGLQENIHTEVAEESETDYKHASKDDRQRNQAYIIAKKNDAEIQALASKIVDISATTNGIGSITLENAYKGLLHRLEISGSMSCLYPSPSLLPKSDLLPIGIYLIVDETDYILDIDYLDYTSVEEHDTFVYEDGKCWIERADGTIEEREGIEIYVESDSSISIEPFTNAIMYCEYLLENEYTSTFANQIEVTSELNLLADTLEAKVSQVADEDGNVTSASIILAVNNDTSQAVIDADKISLDGKEINLTGENINIKSNNFNVDKYGNLICSNATITGGTLNISSPAGVDLITLNDTTNNIGLVINGSKIKFESLGGLYSHITETSAYFSDGTFSGDYSNTSVSLLHGSSYTYVTADGGVNHSSREEYKKDIVKRENNIDLIKNCDVYDFLFKEEEETSKKHIGLIIGNKYNTPKEIISQDGTGINLNDMCGVMWGAIKELIEKNEKLEKEIENLKKEMNK